MNRFSFALGLLLLSALAIGGALGMIFSPPPAPPSLAPSQRLETAEPTELAFRDVHEASFMLTTGPAQMLRSSSSGMLTSFACHDGGQVASGTPVFGVDGVTIVGLATAMPLWRDLEIGDEGSDVAALQAELARLGHGLVVDAYWGSVDSAAFAEMMAAAGAPQSRYSTVRVSTIAWLPAPALTTSACLAGVGTVVATGQALAEFPLSLTSAQVKEQPGNALPGQRVVQAGEQEYAVPEDGRITDAATLAALLDSPEYREAHMESDASMVTFRYLLADPVAVSSIPPSAIYDLESTSGCVQNHGVAVRVEILASQLGQSLVVPEHPLGSVDLRPDSDVGCR